MSSEMGVVKMENSNLITIQEVAKKIDKSTQNVRLWCRDLGIWDDLAVIDGRGTRALTPEQASLVADAARKKKEPPQTIEQEATSTENLVQIQAAFMAAIAAQQTANDQLRADLEQQRITYEARILALEEELRKARVDLNLAQACISELAAAPFWQKRKIINRYMLPPGTQD